MSLDIYKELTRSILPGIKIQTSSQGLWWTCVTSDVGTGLAMTFQEHLDQGWHNPEHLYLDDVARWIFDWDLRKCSFAMAAINAYWNSPEMIDRNFKGEVRLDSMGHKELIEYVTRKLAEDRVVVSVGHFPFLNDIEHKNLHIVEKKPQQKRDLPDTACESILPKANISLITGSSLVNKSLPRLLELARNSYIVLLGPSTPLFPGFSRYGVKKIIGAGLINSPKAIQSMVRNGAGGEIFSCEALSRIEIDYDSNLRRIQ
jgi:uncharacterized protein (DUF4213/DUF364 family)